MATQTSGIIYIYIINNREVTCFIQNVVAVLCLWIGILYYSIIGPTTSILPTDPTPPPYSYIFQYIVPTPVYNVYHQRKKTR